jgi:hypothetical protein
MEPFTLIVWLMMGWLYEETQMADPMGAEQCLELLFAIQADRSPAFQSDRTPAKGECVAGKPRLPRTIRELPPGDWGPLPGRRRV